MSIYSDVIRATGGLVSFWRLGEAAGTTATDELGTNNGTYVNTPTLGAGGALSDDADTAVTLNGSTQRVTAKAGQIISALTNASVEAWVKTSSASEQTIYSERAAAGSDLWTFYVASGGKLAFKHRDDSNVFTGLGGAGPSVNNGTYHHVVMTKSGTTVRLYVDGVDVDGGTLSGGNTLTNAGLAAWIGQTQVDGSFLAGTIDEPAIYSVALAPTTVLAHYNAGRGGILSGLWLPGEPTDQIAA